MMDIGIDILVLPESRGQVESLKYEWGSRRVVFAGVHVPPPNNAGAGIGSLALLYVMSHITERPHA